MTRHPGNVSPYTKMRNRDLRSAFRQIISEEPYIELMDALAKTVKQPARRFYVSEERAFHRICLMLRRGSLPLQLNTRDRMFREILSRVKALREEMPHLSLRACVWRVIRQPAPEFYLTPQSAKVILSTSKTQDNETHP